MSLRTRVVVFVSFVVVIFVSAGAGVDVEVASDLGGGVVVIIAAGSSKQCEHSQKRDEL